LAVFDPLVQESLRNSLLISLGVSLASMVLGLAVASLGRRGGRVGQMLECLSSTSAAVPCSFLGLGLLGWMTLIAERTGTLPTWVRVAAWFWVELAWGVGLVSISASQALRRVFPIWEDAARLAGGRPWLVWRVVVRPVVLPSVVRAGSWVLVGSLFEPTAPLLFGLRRTLAGRLIDAALGSSSDPTARAPSLVILALILGAGFQVLFLTWGGRRAEGLEPTHTERVVGSWNAAAWAGFGLLWMIVLTLAPVAGLIRSAWTEFGSQGAETTVSHFLTLLRQVRPALVDSAILGVSAASLSLLVAGLIGWLSPDSGLARVALWTPTRLPGLALGIGALGLLSIVGGLEPNSSGPALWLSPFATPGVLLVLVVTIALVPQQSHILHLRSVLLSANQRDAARLLGGPRSFARRWRTLVWPSVGPRLLSAWVWTAFLASFETASALVLTPTSAFRPIGPVLLDLAGSSGGAPKAAVLALAGWVLFLVAWTALRPRGLAGEEASASPTTPAS
ncbi:MAG TPA: hypothetical protein VFT74_03685, partial [Isosphaeraceae bacterium]|nr:hypothetical protein [Isosphaeraceae bacterium]